MAIWEQVNFPMKEPDWITRGINKDIQIKKIGPNALNRDKEPDSLLDVYPKLRPATYWQEKETEDYSSMCAEYICW